MSTVRMADYLRREIVRKFEDLYDKSNPVQEISTHVGDKMYDIFLAPKINLFLDTANEQFEGLIDSEALFVTNNELNIKLNLLPSTPSIRTISSLGLNLDPVSFNNSR